MPWRVVEKKIGRAGGLRQRTARQREWDEKYGEDNWEVGYVLVLQRYGYPKERRKVWFLMNLKRMWDFRYRTIEVSSNSKVSFADRRCLLVAESLEKPLVFDNFQTS